MIIASLAIFLTLVLVVALAKPTGLYLAAVFTDQPTRLDRFFGPFENLLYKIGGIRPGSQTWKNYAFSVLIVNSFMMLFVYGVFRLQGVLPLNPSGTTGMDPSLAFNTAISFMTNTNLQHYSGESGLSYLSQMIGILFMMFTAPATALAVVVACVRALADKPMGNFYQDLIRGIVRILLPISLVATFFFVFQGTPQTIEPSVTATTIEGAEQTIARGPVASFLAIKELGNNGGGFFGVNSAHPFENPTGWSNLMQIVLMFLITTATPFMYGKMVGNAKQGRTLFVAMGFVFVMFLSFGLYSEYKGNPLLNELGMDAQSGSMEGKEVRFGTAQSVFYALVTTASETGAVNTMHDTLTPLTGMLPLVAMMLNTLYGGIGAGFLNVLMYAMIAVFLAGLMVGRTPEFLGKKLEGKEMKLIAVTLLIQPLLILGFTALALYTPLGKDAISNTGFHGISQVLYEYTSSVANNGSGFEGLGDATVFWNTTTGIAMFVGRYVGLIALLAIAASLASKRRVPETAGTLRTDTPLFGALFIGTICIVGALTFFPALVLGPVAEYVTLTK